MSISRRIALQILACAIGLLAPLGMSQANSLVTSMIPGLAGQSLTIANDTVVLDVAERKKQPERIKKRRRQKTQNKQERLRTKMQRREEVKRRRLERRKKRGEGEITRKQRRKLQQRSKQERRKLRQQRRRAERKNRRRRSRPKFYFDIYPGYRDPGFFGHYYDQRYRYDPYVYEPYYDGPRYGARLTCKQARRIIRRKGYSRLRRRDCTGTVYRFRARRHGRRYDIRISAYTGAILSVRRY